MLYYEQINNSEVTDGSLADHSGTVVTADSGLRSYTHSLHVRRGEVHGVEPLLQVGERGRDDAAREGRVRGVREVRQYRPHGVRGRLQLARKRRVVRGRLELYVAADLTDVYVHAWNNYFF